MSDLLTIKQIALEDDMIRTGYTNTLARIHAAATNGRLADLDGTTKLQEVWTRKMYDLLMAEMEADGVADGRSRNEAFKYIRKLSDPATAVLITVRALLNRMMLRGKSLKLSTVATEVANSIITQASLDDYEKKNKKALKQAKDKAESMPTHLRAAFLKKQAEKSTPWLTVDTPTNIKIGTTLLNIAAEAGVCEITKVPDGSNLAFTITYTDEAFNLLRTAGEDMAASKAYFWPMVVPPREYTTYNAQGPYISRAANFNFMLILRDYSKTQARRMQGMVSNGKASAEPLKALNTIQNTAWCVNREQLDLLRPLITETPELCPKLSLPRDATLSEWVEFEDRTSPEAKAFYSAFFGEREAMVAARSTEMLALTALDLALKFQDEPELYFPHALDSRGRAYPIVSGLSPQGNDFAQSLLMFAEGKVLTEVGARHMAIEGANLYGVDKVSNDDREMWTLMHTDEIRAAADDPMSQGNLAFWQRPTSLSFSSHGAASGHVTLMTRTTPCVSGSSEMARTTGCSTMRPCRATRGLLRLSISRTQRCPRTSMATSPRPHSGYQGRAERGGQGDCPAVARLWPDAGRHQAVGHDDALRQLAALPDGLHPRRGEGQDPEG